MDKNGRDKKEIFVPFGGGIHMSLHRSDKENAKAILDMVERYYRRLEEAYREQCREDMMDFAYTYFLFAWSFMADWIEIRNASSENQRICRDLANGVKHGSLRNPSYPIKDREGSGSLALAFNWNYDTDSSFLCVHFSIDGQSQIIHRCALHIADEILKDCKKLFDTKTWDKSTS